MTDDAIQYEHLTPTQQDQARARFCNARRGDGYWYRLVGGSVLSRSRATEHSCTYPRCRCPLDHPGTPGWCAAGRGNRSQ